MFIIIKTGLGILLASFWKTRWPPRAFFDGNFGDPSCYPSLAKTIIVRVLKFAGYVHHYKSLPGNIFGLILKNKMAATGVSLTIMCVRFSCYPSLAKTIIVRLLKFAGYVHYYKSLPGNISGLILKNKMAATGVSLTIMCVRFSCYPSLAKTIIVRLLKFAGYVHYYKKLAWEYFWPHFEKQDGCHRHLNFGGNGKCCLSRKPLEIERFGANFGPFGY